MQCLSLCNHFGLRACIKGAENEHLAMWKGPSALNIFCTVRSSGQRHVSEVWGVSGVSECVWSGAAWGQPHSSGGQAHGVSHVLPPTYQYFGTLSNPVTAVWYHSRCSPNSLTCFWECSHPLGAFSCHTKRWSCSWPYVQSHLKQA